MTLARRTRLLSVFARVGVACGSIAAAASVGSVSAASSSHFHASRNVPGATSAGNRRAAERDAERLLGLATLPPGAVRLSVEPGGDDKLLSRPAPGPTEQAVDRYGWWRVRAVVGAVVAFLHAHQPSGSDLPGSDLAESGQAGGPGVPDNQMLSFHSHRSADLPRCAR